MQIAPSMSWLCSLGATASIQVLRDGHAMLMARLQVVPEGLEGDTFAGFERSFGILHAVLLHWPGVGRSEVKQVPQVGVVARWLENVAVVDAWV